VYIGPNSRTERPRKTKIGTEVAHVTRDSDTTFKVKRSKVNLQGHIVAASRTACSILNAIVFLFHFTQNVDVCTLPSLTTFRTSVFVKKNFGAACFCPILILNREMTMRGRCLLVWSISGRCGEAGSTSASHVTNRKRARSTRYIAISAAPADCANASTPA